MEQHDRQNAPTSDDANPNEPDVEESTSPLSSSTYANHSLLIQTWLNLLTAREQRRFLEDHCYLLDEHSETILYALLDQAIGDVVQTKRQREALLLWQDARSRGGTAEAVREAFINLHGGFVLDVPPWLEEVDQRLNVLRQARSPEQSAVARAELLQEALQKIQGDTTYPPELQAILRRGLADAWRRHPGAERSKAIEMALSLYTEVSLVYTLTRYPYQYAQLQKNMGIIYFERIAGERRENQEQAILCFHEALRVWTRETFPFEYADMQSGLGNIYTQRITGERRENLELAITHYHQASHILTFDNVLPSSYAGLHNNLGNAYAQRIAGERRENLELAIAHYHETLRVLDT
ncbi:hypothetical protein [Dictyobacter kobayashii]|uniref:Tetratricopeptide repeat protein n=1 Tax=Dictyobacter kobayashii TaxID=2014872 RepID=A0A402ATV3_9CHLR|nr:hypothetical protein [Dictyobacter kobayashii]GCE22527.1 hypothetical protein KDK_63270 [Dictyobacter kobayashii]